MNHLKRSMLTCLLALVLTTLLTAGVVQAAGLTGKTWSVVPSPNVGPHSNYLRSVAAVSATDIWAVGSHRGHGSDQTLIEHWNGTSWQVVPSPISGSNDGSLSGVVAVSATDIWAVGGYYNNSVGFAQTLIEHWNGTRWHIISSPNPGSGNNVLFGVAAISTNNIWAVGYFQPVNSPEQTLIEHWNGTSWQVVPSPNPPGSNQNFLSGVAVVSATNIWAVGGPLQTLIEHWNGTSWQIISSPSPGSIFNQLSGVAVVSANDIWAVGYSYNSGGPDQTLIEHWDGTSWQVVSSPNVGSYSNSLLGVARVPGSSNLWTVGAYSANSYGTSQTLTEFYG